ncbi:hypothetical protein VKT23_000265 [Stygiomarasmius scandens]|uniref:Actin-like ATPase domain-containing protein n=1 Tax=Marasmiellus scandens TaxID=2682957 RepID=A0ABR1K914_9AGAR
MSSTRKPYNGNQRNLLISMDVGTTFSGVSYSLLDPGIVPEIKAVTRFPAQEHVGGDAKVPSIIYYGQDGSVKAVGAEAAREGILESVEDEGWILCEWFKLHLRPDKSQSDCVGQAIHPLPPNKTAVTVFADFLCYLVECAKSFIIQSMPNGASFWESVEERIQFVLSHPNGWEGAQQSQMRRAAIQAGLIADSMKDRDRVQFVTEGEASLHYCLNNGCDASTDGIIVVDAGGGTVDLSAYQRDSNELLMFKEIARPQCHFTGSIFVTNQARQYLQSKLANSRYLEDIDHICRCFDKNTKLTFKNVNDPAFIKFGGVRDRDLDVGIRSGQLKLPGTEVAKFFEPSVNSIIEGINAYRTELTDSTKRIDTVFLIGGFATNDYLFEKLEEFLQPKGITVCRPQSYLNKAVADGAASFHVDHFVGSRIARWDYGIKVRTPYKATNAEHQRREHTTVFNAAGEKRVPNSFDIILSKGTEVAETKEFCQSYHRTYSPEKRYTMYNISDPILCYRGQNATPTWVDIDADNYIALCRIKADTTPFITTARRTLSNGQVYYQLNYSIILSFGLTELKAQYAWVENGVEKR